MEEAVVVPDFPRHGAIRVTPAMESKLTDHVWNLAELLA
jgi:hypothetical protein